MCFHARNIIKLCVESLLICLSVLNDEKVRNVLNRMITLKMSATLLCVTNEQIYNFTIISYHITEMIGPRSIMSNWNRYI